RHADPLHAGLRLLVQRLGAADVLPLGEETGAGDMVEFDADTIGVLKEDRIIARRPGFLLRRVDDGDIVAVPEKGVEPVDRSTVAEAETGVVQPRCALVEAFAYIPGSSGAHADGGAAPHSIEHGLIVEHDLELEIADERAPEGSRTHEVARGQNDVPDAVEIVHSLRSQ